MVYKVIYNDSEFLSNMDTDYFEIFTEILPSLKINVELLDRLYSGEFDFSTEESNNILTSLHMLSSGRLNEFIFYLLINNHNFNNLNVDIMSVVNIEKEKFNKSIGQFIIDKPIRYGYLNIVKYLIERDNINIHERNEYIFRNAATYGYVDILKYLISLEPTHGKINIHAEVEQAIRNAIVYGKLDVIIYLLSLISTHGDFIIPTLGEYILMNAAIEGHSDVIKYLLSPAYTYDKIDIHFNDEYVFFSCS